MALGVAVGTALAIGIAVPAHAETGTKALVLDSSVSGGAGSVEATRAAANGFSVTVVDDATWSSMSASQFADFQLVVVGDPTCNLLPAVVSQNARNLADAVMARAGGNAKVGNRVLIGSDPIFHRFGGDTGRGGQRLTETGIDFTSVVDGATSLYLTFSCSDQDWDANGVPDAEDKLLPLLTIDPTPGWSQNRSPQCSGEASLISAVDQFAALTSADLKNWFCSAHETFPTYPTDWTPLAVSTDAPTQPTCGTDVDTGQVACGEAHILIAGTGIVAEAPNLTLTPPTAERPVGTQHVVTAEVDNNADQPQQDVLVDFLVTGANSGAAGTCSPADCRTDADGRVTFTYTGANVGNDTINGSISFNGSTQTATAAVTWTPAVVRSEVSIDDVRVDEGHTGTTPATFTVSLSEPASAPVSVAYATADGTATSPSDYTAGSGTVTFAAGERSKSVVVGVRGDLVDEPDETFQVRLSDATGPATIADDAGTGTIADDDRDGAFLCRATGLRIGTGELSVANGPLAPCKDGQRSLLRITGAALGVPGLAAYVLNASTNATPDDPTRAPTASDSGRAHAAATEVQLLVGGTLVSLKVLEADASAGCTATGTPRLSGSSRVVGLRIGGKPAVDVSKPTTIPLGLATLHLNHQTVSGGKVTQRALWVSSSLLPHIVIGEAVAGAAGNPCSA